LQDEIILLDQVSLWKAASRLQVEIVLLDNEQEFDEEESIHFW